MNVVFLAIFSLNLSQGQFEFITEDQSTDFFIIFGEVRMAQLAKTALLTSMLVPLGSF